MTQEEARKSAEVMMAYANGEEIETLSFNEYVPCENPTFNWITAKGVENYRIKPKEKFNPKTLQPFDKVLVRDDAIWCCDFFSHTMDSYNQKRYMCAVGMAAKVIPYNDETKHLVGTSDEAPEYYRYWED